MLDEHALAELRATFQVELEEHCRVLTRTFLALEKEPETAERGRLLDAAFRSAHNLKGAARAVDLGTIEGLAHRLESVLAAAKRDELVLEPAVFDLLYTAVDSLGAGLDDHQPGSPSDVRLIDIGDQLEAAWTEKRQATSGAAAPAPAEPTPVATPIGSAAPPLPISGAERSPAKVRPVGIGFGETVRLPTARLDGLLEQFGEVVIPRLELEEGLDDIAALCAEVDGWQREWRKVRPRLRQLDREDAPAGLRPLLRFLEHNDMRLASLAPRLNTLHARLVSPTRQLATVTDDLQAEVKRFRMLPFGQLGDALERAVRDLARGLGKEARLVLVGSDTHVDRRALEELKDPLLHLIRNALDHGIEPPPERQRLGKPTIGSVVVAAEQRGSSIVIDVEDDGSGIAPATIRQAASERGLVAEGQISAMHDSEVLRLIFLPGFSTRSGVGEVSGRGVGLDAVARAVEQLGGRVDLESTPGKGTRFSLTVPVTLATTRALLVAAGEAVYALPIAAVERVLHPERIASLGGRLVIEQDGTTVPIEPLPKLLQMTSGQNGSLAAELRTVVLVAVGTQRVGLGIDRVIGEQEIVLKPLPYPALRVRHVAGATVLGSGRVVPILNVADLVRTAARTGPTVTVTAPAELERKPVRVLVADDSLTTRSLERYILEAAGYEVELAGDGLEALTLLQEGACDILVSDVDMPVLTGIDLTVKVRADPKLRHLPVILMTSLDSAEDRERGLEAGADAYIVKSSFDQGELLSRLRELA